MAVPANAADFRELARVLEEDANLREHIREAVRTLEGDVRTITSELAAAHMTPEPDFPTLASRARGHLPPIQAGIAALAALIPKGLFYRYNGGFNQTIQQAAFAVLYIGFLEADRLVTIDEVSQALKIEPKWVDESGFQLTTEDYLHAIISLSNDLARLSPNQVTLAAQRNLPLHVPLRISRFTKELASGFALLNLKNDTLRRRFDSLKYDVKAIEQVLYDVTLRGLIAPDAGNKRPRPDESIDTA